MTAIKESQNEFMDWVNNSEAFRIPKCAKDFGDSTCDYPACGCHCAPIKAEAFKEPESWPPIQFAEPRTQEKHAVHMEMTNEPRTPSHFRPLLKYALASALFVGLTIAVLFLAAMSQIFASVF